VSVPSSPYCTSEEVAYALKQLAFPGMTPGDFADDGTTNPTKTEVDFWIANTAAEIDMAFMRAGYKIPFAQWSSDDSWPTHQTNFLRFLNVLGAAAAITGLAMKPAPSQPMERDTEQANAYEARFKALLDDVRENVIRFRADCYAGTNAYVGLVEPRAPMTDFGEGLIDGADYLELTGYTLLRMAIGETWAAWGGADTIDGYDWDTLRAWGQR